MPRLSGAPIILTPAQAADLQRLARAHKTPRKLAERAEMILRSAAGTAVREIARQLELWPKTVRHWHACWLASAADAPVTARLADAARPGAPATFTPEQVCAIMALACEPPEQSDLPLSHWSQSELGFPPGSGGMRSERHATARIAIASMLARASTGVR